MLRTGTITLLLGLWVCLGTGCQDMWESKPFTHDLGDLGRADRIEVADAGGKPISQITDLRRVHSVVAFIERYRDGWVDMYNGVGFERGVTFYSGATVLTTVGVGPAGINDGTYLRRLSDNEVKELAGLLDIPPPPERPGAQ